MAWKIDSIFSTFPAAAVPVSVKIPDPITAPMPKAVMLQGPRLLRSRCAGSSEASISASMLLVRSSWEPTLREAREADRPVPSVRRLSGSC